MLPWLHLSDFHFGESELYDRRVLNRSLLQAIGERRERGWRPELIFITGDLADRGAEAEYRCAERFLLDLLEVTELSRDRLFVVPGNHDVRRAEGTYLLRTLRTQDESDHYFGSSRSRPHVAKFAEFQSWHERFFAGFHDTDPVSCCAVSRTLDVGGVKVGVIPLNTALFSQDDDDHGKLLLRCTPNGAARGRWLQPAWHRDAVEIVPAAERRGVPATE